MNPKKNRTKHTNAELAEALIFPVELTSSQKKVAAKQLTVARELAQKKMSETERLSLKIYQLRFQLEDYINNKDFNPEFSFGRMLKQYVELLQIKRKEFAQDISIDETLLSQFINQHRMPPDYITIRLEIHSNNSIPAMYWFKLVEKQRAHELQTDKDLRRKEKRNVHRRLAVTI